MAGFTSQESAIANATAQHGKQARSEIRRQMLASEITLDRLFDDRPRCLHATAMTAILRWVPRLGATRVERIANDAFACGIILGDPLGRQPVRVLLWLLDHPDVIAAARNHHGRQVAAS